MATRTYTDLDASFEPNPTTGDLMTRSDEKAIKFAIRSLIMTNYYERPFRSFVGSPITGLIFSTAGPNFTTILKQSIQDVITNFEPRVNVLGVDVVDSIDNNRVYVDIKFKIKSSEEEITFGLTLKRTR